MKQVYNISCHCAGLKVSKPGLGPANLHQGFSDIEVRILQQLCTGGDTTDAKERWDSLDKNSFVCKDLVITLMTSEVWSQCSS